MDKDIVKALGPQPLNVVVQEPRTWNVTEITRGP